MIYTTTTERFFDELPERLTISIERADIEVGVQYDCRQCPGALALERVVKNVRGLDHVAVGLSVATLTIHGLHETHEMKADYTIPKSLHDWILRFDKQGSSPLLYGRYDPVRTLRCSLAKERYWMRERMAG